MNDDFDSSQTLQSLTDNNDTNVARNSSKETNVEFKTPKRMTKTIKNPSKQQKINTSLDNAIEALKFACSQKSTLNEFQIFGQFVASQLEKLPLDITLNLQSEIQNLLAQARLRSMNNIHYDSNSSSSSTTSIILNNCESMPQDSENSQSLFNTPVENETSTSISMYFNNWEDTED